jgi:multidrug efflux pump subunit AcrA (membrane-fusion protein)
MDSIKDEKRRLISQSGCDPKTPPNPRAGSWGRVFSPARLIWSVVQQNSWLSFAVVVSAAMGLAIVITIVLPGYTWPSSRLYTSKFGYSSLLRKLKKPFPVPSARITRRVLSHTALGEGLMRTEPTLIPIVPMGTISRVLVKDGDRVRKGQLVAELDPLKAEIKVGAAEAALATARAELERVKIGSAYILTFERPMKDQLNLHYDQKSVDIQTKLLEISQTLNKVKYASKQEMLMLQLALNQMEQNLEMTKFNLQMSTRGIKHSIAIAEANVKEMELALKHRQTELKEYKILSNADGVVERCLIHEGEYNQDPGKPGFLVAMDGWFEANFDQGSFNRLRVDEKAEIRLEAYPDRFFVGRVIWVNPFVNYDLGGPESTRPIRPMGTGAPEWPATFAARIQLDPTTVSIAPGMTGFCVIRSKQEVNCLPREAVSAVTGGKGIVYLIHGNRFEPHEVILGIIDGDWIQIREGLDESDEVILDGYQVLEPTDQIQIVRSPPARGNS